MTMPDPDANRFPQRIFRMAKTVGTVAKFVAENPEEAKNTSLNSVVRKAAYKSGSANVNQEAAQAKRDFEGFRRMGNPNNKIAKFITEAGATPNIGKNLRKMAGKAIIKGVAKAIQNRQQKPPTH